MPVLPPPDPARGLFETLLVVDGKPIELGAHLDRLAASLAALCDGELPVGLGDLIAERAREFELGRLRATVYPPGAAPDLAAEPVDPAQVFPTWERGAELRSLPCPGGFGAHKWWDRTRLEGVAPPAVPLLLDRADELLEAGRANVFAVFGETLATPMADGRILAGIARAGAIASAREEGIEVTERRLRRADLFAADGVFLTGSVRGVEPARSLDGEPLGTGTELSRRVGAGLRRRWGLAPAADAAPAPAVAQPPGPPGR
jgi:para-aminobenzoate synthetase/4-amino-4-deoxychorismate lyase